MSVTYGNTGEEFAALVNSTQDFYGVCDTMFKLGDQVFDAVEDPADGYRSYLDSINITDSEEARAAIFFRTPVAKVHVWGARVPENFDGYEFRDIFDGHCWLRIGTANTDDYYPYFVFEYEPRREEAKPDADDR